jgi:hypothetical protein
VRRAIVGRCYRASRGTLSARPAGGGNLAPPHRALVLGPGTAGAGNEVMVREALYDTVADWYASWVGEGTG